MQFTGYLKFEYSSKDSKNSNTVL